MRLTALLLCFLLSASSGALLAAPRTVRVIVAVPAGSTGDFVARSLAERLGASSDQSYVVENRTGAGGNIAAEFVAKSPPDGTTLLISIGTTLTVNPHIYRQIPFDPKSDLRPVSILVTSGTVLVVHPSVPANSAGEFVTYAKQSPSSYATGGNGSPSHLSMEYFGMLAGFRATPVPYRGNSPAVTDLVSGQIKVAFPAIGSVADHIQGGRLKGLAYAGDSRSPLLPQLPTMRESGFPGFQVETQLVLSAPAGIPDETVHNLERKIKEVLDNDATREKLKRQGYQIVASTSAQAKHLLDEEREKWGQVVRAAKITVE